ncbi:MAG TPA: hypothetical protein VHH36_07560 [Candidatus Thermoplasmatota archaeon]|nr:hypothetical protein [Candidatus Thermoplasmatota archaeon]
MPRGVRRVVVYVCTLNGQIYTSAREAKAEAARLREKLSARETAAKAKRGKRHGAQTESLLRELREPRKPIDLRKRLKGKVKEANIGPMLHRFVKDGLVKRADGTYELTAKGKERLAETG